MQKLEEKITLSKTELEKLIADAVADRIIDRPKVVTPQNLFDEVKFDMSKDIAPINEKYPLVMRLLASKSKNIFTNVKYLHGFATYENRKIYRGDVHDRIRKLVLAIFGKSMNSELTRDEYRLAQLFYSELVEWYVSKYDYRLSEIYGDEKSDSASKQ